MRRSGLRIRKANSRPGDLPDDFYFLGGEPPDLAGGQGMGKKPKRPIVKLAPAAAVTSAQFDEVDWTLILCVPSARRDFPYPWIDLHDGAQSSGMVPPKGVTRGQLPAVQHTFRRCLQRSALAANPQRAIHRIPDR